MTSSATSLTINPTALKIGQQVDIESRTWPGINKPGGHATITKLHYAADSTTTYGGGETTTTTNGAPPTKIDVKYVLGGSEKQIEIIYVKPHIELVRGGRSRRVDKKMNVDSFGGSCSSSLGEKENNGVGGIGRKSRGSGNNKRKSGGGGLEDGDKSDAKKKKKVVQPKKKKKENVTAAAKIEVDKPKIVETDDKKKQNKSAPPKKEGMKKTAAAAGSSSIKTKSIASYFFTTASSAAETTTTTSVSAKAKKAEGPSKPTKAAKETTKNIKTTTKSTTKSKPTDTKSNSATTTTKKNSSKQVKYSPNSILAVRAAHAKSPGQSHIFGTKTIGFEGFQFSSSTTATAATSVGATGGGGKNSKKKRGSGVQESLFLEEDGEKSTSAAAAAATATMISSSAASSKKKVTPASEKKSGVSSSSKKKKVIPSSSALETKAGVSSSSDKSAQNHKTMQTLYKNECVKAQDFVKSMVGSATNEEGKDEEKVMMEEKDVTSSPESCLELEMDSGRMDLFNSLLSEVMFQKGLDSMDVDELICSINTSSQRGVLQRPFTLLEVKAFLQELDSQNRIFVSWEEDNTGTVYSI